MDITDQTTDNTDAEPSDIAEPATPPDAAPMRLQAACHWALGTNQTLVQACLQIADATGLTALFTTAQT